MTTMFVLPDVNTPRVYVGAGGSSPGSGQTPLQKMKGKGTPYEPVMSSNAPFKPGMHVHSFGGSETLSTALRTTSEGQLFEGTEHGVLWVHLLRRPLPLGNGDVVKAVCSRCHIADFLLSTH